MATNNSQLKLITFDDTWRLDPKTIEVGRAGVARARAVLADTKNKSTRDTSSIAA